MQFTAQPEVKQTTSQQPDVALITLHLERLQ